MTRVTFKRNKGIIYGIEANGHAGYDNTGKDIVCSAISTACQMCTMYLQKIVAPFTYCKYEKDDVKGYLLFEICNINHADNIRVKTAFEMTLDALMDIAENEEFADYLYVEVIDDDEC